MRIHLRESLSPPPWSHPLRELQERPQSVPHLFSSEFRVSWHVEVTWDSPPQTSQNCWRQLRKLVT
jgi:hypothetical protein